MAKKARSEEQILRALHQAESGERVADICREHGVSEATFYVWKKKYSGLALNELRELCQRRTKLSLFRRCRCPSFNELFVYRALTRLLVAPDSYAVLAPGDFAESRAGAAVFSGAC
jgi:putative transposase